MSKVIDNIEDIASIDNHIGLSGITAYHLLQGNLAVDNTVTTQGFNTALYTGNGSTQSINTGIDMATTWGNDVSEQFGGLVWLKNRGTTNAHNLFDTVRGHSYTVQTQSTAGQADYASNFSTFNNNGFSLSSSSNEINGNAGTFASWNFQTTHRISGTTNHGKTYTCHFNPFTGFTIVKYEGSGIAGHEIPHHLGRKLGFATTKLTSTASQWRTYLEHLGFSNHLLLNGNSAVIADTTMFTGSSEQSLILGNNEPNTSGQQCVMYGWANSYFDETNKLIGNYEVGVYQGTGASGNKVVTRGKPAWVMVKRLDSTGYWAILDNQRGNGSLSLYANMSNAEANDASDCTFESNSFTLTNTGNDINTSGGQYLYMVAYDTNSNGGGSYYPRATDTSNLNISNAIIPYANGVDSNGSKITTLSKNETISGLTLTAGKNYVYSKNDGTYGVKSIAPNYGKTNPTNGGDFYDVLENKWYTSAGVEIPESRNYMNHIVYADNDGSPLYVEELPKMEYKDIIKANEYRGKNACTAWVNFDGTTTPPTIRDSYNVSSVVRTATGVYDIYFATPMDNVNYVATCTSTPTSDNLEQGWGQNFYLDKISVINSAGATRLNTNKFNIQFIGGKNA